MMSIPTDLLERALQLDEEDREILMYQLRLSLPEPDEGWWEAWAEEIERRSEEYESGKVEAIPAEEVIEELRRKAGRRDAS